MSELVDELINDKGVCRTAPATPGLLNLLISPEIEYNQFGSSKLPYTADGVGRSLCIGYRLAERAEFRCTTPMFSAPPVGRFGETNF